MLLALLVVAAAFAVYGVANAVVSHQGSEIIGQVAEAASANDAKTLQMLSRASLEQQLNALQSSINDIPAAVAQGSSGQSLSETFVTTKGELGSSGIIAKAEYSYPFDITYKTGSVKLMDLPAWVDERTNCEATVQPVGFVQAEAMRGGYGYTYMAYTGNDFENVQPVFVEKDDWLSSSAGVKAATIKFTQGSSSKKATVKRNSIRRCAYFLHDDWAARIVSSVGACRDTLGQIVTNSDYPLYYNFASHTHTSTNDCNDERYRTYYPDNGPPWPCDIAKTRDGMRYAKEPVLTSSPDLCEVEYKPGSLPTTPSSVWLNMRSSEYQSGASSCSVKVTCAGKASFGNIPIYVSAGSGTCTDRCSSIGLNAVCVTTGSGSIVTCTANPDSTGTGCWCTN